MLHPLWATYVAVLAAEILGDKFLYTTGILSTRYRTFPMMIGIAVAFMSRHVDWERPELFHWGFDELSAFLCERVSRHYAFRSDYGLYEYTTFVWRTPRRPPALPNDWCTT